MNPEQARRVNAGYRAVMAAVRRGALSPNRAYAYAQQIAAGEIEPGIVDALAAPTGGADRRVLAAAGDVGERVMDILQGTVAASPDMAGVPDSFIRLFADHASQAGAVGFPPLPEDDVSSPTGPGHYQAPRGGPGPVDGWPKPGRGGTNAFGYTQASADDVDDDGYWTTAYLRRELFGED